MNSIISWVGGKKALRDLIYQRMPKEFGRYIEVFGGGGWVLFGRPPDTSMEVYNDFNSDLVNLFRCVNALKQKKLELVREQKMAENFQQRLDDMDACLKKTTCEVRDFDNDLVRRLLLNIKAVKDDIIEIQFKSGIVMDQRVSYYE